MIVWVLAAAYLAWCVNVVITSLALGCVIGDAVLGRGIRVVLLAVTLVLLTVSITAASVCSAGITVLGGMP